jgi:two-component system cell cycle response regulator DivK
LNHHARVTGAIPVQDAPARRGGSSFGSDVARLGTWGNQARRKQEHLFEIGGGMAKTVLIVEDNELNMKLFRDLLEAHGYQTVGTSNGYEALDLVRSLRPDLILMDIQLPQVSGLEVTGWIKQDPAIAMIPVVAVTAFAMKGDEERIREGGCEAYLSKPISVGKFIETVRRFIG